MAERMTNKDILKFMETTMHMNPVSYADFEVANLFWCIYCTRNNLEVDTKSYDDIMLDMWEKLVHRELFDNKFDNFYNFFCEKLV